MTDQEIEETIGSLVETRYPYEVKAILDAIEDDRDRATVVAAALARSVTKGERIGREQAQREVRQRLGL